MNANSATGSTPFHFDFKRRDLGHRVACCEPSARKSVLMSEIAALYAPNPSDEPQVEPPQMIVLVHGTPGAGMTLYATAGDHPWK